MQKVLQGDVSEVSGLIDTSPYAKKYTSGCLSFYEHDLSDHDKQKIMQDFEQALFLAWIRASTVSCGLSIKTN